MFHPTLHLIAAASSRPSIHIFEINKSIEKCIEAKTYGFSADDMQKNAGAENKKSGFSFMKVVANFFDSDSCIAKIKVEEQAKVIAFDEKNKRLTVMTHDRILYFFDIPEKQVRYVEEA